VIDLLDRLPQRNLVAGSELIARGPYGLQPVYSFGEGDVLQLRDSVFAVVGDYTTSEDSIYTRILIDYPTGHDAESAWKHLRGNLDSYIEIVDDSLPRRFVFKDYRDRFGLARLTGQRIDLAVNLQAPPSADLLQ
jgi:hypothetical protein